ncbi:MAG: transglycosylase domain-containing protein [Actinomycetota bacterium]
MIKRVCLGCVIILIAGSCSTAAKVDEASLTPKTESTKILAADGSLVTTLKQEENREILPLDQIPVRMRNAVIGIEDARFYAHRGIDAKAIGRAIAANSASGKVVEGGSTITQQLVRNALTTVGKEQTFQRKLKEAVYAYDVDRKYSKDKILELYLNTVYFGEGAYGVETAAQTYFGKGVKGLSLADSALIAGLIRSPLNYDPWTNPIGSLKRRNRVLDRMAITHLITKKQAEAAKQAPIGVREKPAAERYDAPYFVDYVTRQIQRSDEFAALGGTEQARGNALFRRGLRIHTTLDMRMQRAAEDSIRTILPDRTDPSATLVSIDPKNGYVKALVGGRDYFAAPPDDPCIIAGAINADGSPKFCGKVNLALGQGGGGSGRQGGSSFKPFVLAAALQNGIRETDVYAAPSCIEIPDADAGGTMPWRACNYEEDSSGSVTVGEGTYRSINTVYAQIINDIGIRRPVKGVFAAEAGAQEVVETAERMGLCESTRPLLPKGQECHLAAVPSAALGANSVSTLDMTSAFTSFSNLGLRPRPISVIKITDAKGKVLWAAPEKKDQVISPTVAYLANGVLQDVVTKGTAARNGKLGRPAFGKTGTSQEWRDAWFVGGAGTDLVTGVSVFWPDGEIEMKASCSGSRTQYQIKQTTSGPIAEPPQCRQTRIKVFGGSWPTQIWQAFMTRALEGTPPSQFPVPKLETISVKVDAGQGCLPSLVTPRDSIVTRTFLKGTEPTEPCTEARAPSPPVIETPSPEPAPEEELDPFGLEPGVKRPVPNVEGMSAATAASVLRAAGYNVEIVYGNDCPSPNCTVTRQSDDEAESGDSIRIKVKDDS